MEILPLQNIIISDATTPDAMDMEPLHMAAHPEVVPVEPKSHVPWHGHYASGWDQDMAHTTAKQAGGSTVDSLNYMSTTGAAPYPTAVSYSSIVNDQPRGRMSAQRADSPVAQPALPSLPVVISLPIKVDGEYVETQSFPLSSTSHAAVSPVTRLIPSVVSNDEGSDCSTVANPWYVPTPGVVRNMPNPLLNIHAKPVETSMYPPDPTCNTCLTVDDGNRAKTPKCAVSTQPPATEVPTGSLHTPEAAADAHPADSPQEGQQNVTNDTHAVVASQQVPATTASDLDANPTGALTTVEEIESPRDGSMPAQTRSKAPLLSRTPEPAKSDVAALASGLYGRERNQKRAATKAYRQAITPRALRSADTKKAAERAASPTAVTTNKTKRAAPTAEGPKEKRPRSSSTAASTRSRRATHPVDVDERKPQEAQQTSAGKSGQSVTGLRPFRDVEYDRQYVAQLREVLELRSKARKADMGKRQAARINDLLGLATYPSDKEALFLTKEDATEAVSLGKFFNGPIFTEGQQALPLQTVSEFCDEYYDDDTMVWIQDPEVKPTMKAQIARQVKMGTVKERLAGPESDKPWNCLELATHSDDGLKPSFLNTEDCRLLTKLKIPDPQDRPEARRRTYFPGYKEVEKWALLAQAGALTEPHQDSHGYSTYITINQGQVGFGWLSFPSDEERAAWRRNPAIFRGGNWRYVVLKPGQTVYFPAGTVHFVFRLPSGGNTLAFGGHVLRCSNIVHWVKTLIEERNAKDITNEDLTDSAPGYLSRVEKFVKQARVTGQEEKWGGEASIKEFLRLKEEFLKRKQK